MRGLLSDCSAEKLGEIVERSLSYAECLRELGYVAISGTILKNLKSRISELGIDTSHFDRKEPVVRTRENVFIENSTCSQKVLRRWFLKENVPYECSICGQKPFWNGQEMIMILDHINGINNDDRLENLRWVCPNCNSQLPTTNGKNIKNKHKVEHKFFCSECGRPVSRGRTICRMCVSAKSRKAERPPVLEFAKMVKELGFTGVGAKYGISGKAVQAWCQDHYNIPHKKEDLIAWYNEQIGMPNPIKKKWKKKNKGEVRGEVPPPKPVHQIDPKTNKIINTFSSINDAARTIGGNHTHISKVCNGNRNTAYGYKWAFVE